MPVSDAELAKMTIVGEIEQNGLKIQWKYVTPTGITLTKRDHAFAGEVFDWDGF